LSVGDRGIVSQHPCMRKSGSSMRNISSVVTRKPTAAATAFGEKDVRRRWKDKVNTRYNHGEEPDSYSNYSSCKEFPAASHPNVHSSRDEGGSTYVPRYKVLGGSQYRAEATMQRGSLKWSLGDPVSTPSPTLQALIHHLGR
ncbi:hypothetical protein ALC57_06994, partial [Trachymyrmex cornetzi]